MVSEDEEQAADADQELEILMQSEESNIFYYNQRFRGTFQPKANCARLPIDKDLDMRFMFGRMDRKHVAPRCHRNLKLTRC